MTKETCNVIHLPSSWQNHRDIVREALDLGCSRAKVISTKTISLGNWVRLQCQYGCSHYGKLLTCPPFSPAADETSDILMDYDKALLIHCGDNASPVDTGIQLETKLKDQGFYKAFALQARPCDLCEDCTIDTHCRYPEKARPTLQACGINVPMTLANNGWENDSPFRPCVETENIAMVLLD